MRLGLIMKRERCKRMLTQLEVEARGGPCNTWISQVETEARGQNISIGSFIKWCRAVGCKPSDIMKQLEQNGSSDNAGDS